MGDLAERIVTEPGKLTITHAHAAFTIRQTWVAAFDKPAAVVMLEIDTARPLRLRASFVPEMRPMWPASFGGQSSDFDGKEHARVLGEATRKHAAVVGSPLFSRTSEQIGHQLPDRAVLMEMEITPEAARQPIPIVLVGSDPELTMRCAFIEKCWPRCRKRWTSPRATIANFLDRTMRVETPEPVLNEALRAAEVAMDKGWICVDRVGCGLVAGFGPAGASERPGFAWFFGGDALMNSWSILDYGDLARTRQVLEFQRAHQRADGKMMHELTQSAALLDWSKYPYGYFHADTTP